MLKRYLLVLVVVAFAVASWSLPAKQASGQEMVDFINNKKGGTWKAKLNTRFVNMDIEQIKKMLGAKKRHENPRQSEFKIQPKFTGNLDDIPKEFDARKQWPQCSDIISTIADQSACGSCWAVSSASVKLVWPEPKIGKSFSSKDILSCCAACGFGCEGGWPDEAFQFWKNTGVVSGSGYKADQGCQPYPFPECEHHVNKTTYKACSKKEYNTPKCQKSCQISYKARSYKDDKSFGASLSFYSLDIAGIQNEIMTNGPVVFTYDVYEDFLNYQSGIYQYTKGNFVGSHAVRGIGWGEENGTPYWLMANSWNADWGDKGYFKIIRGFDNCGIENEISTATLKQ